MPAAPTEPGRHRLVLALAGMAAAAHGGWTIVTAPMIRLLHDHLADDAFYYFDLARHFPRPEVTPGVTTTGFHPMYWLLTGPVFRLLPGGAAVRAALLLLLAAQLATGAVLYALLRRPFRPVIATAVAVLWWTAPVVRLLTLLGLETPLAVLLVLLVFGAADGGVRRGSGAGLGLLVGLSCLARTDSAVIGAAIVIAAGWRARPFVAGTVRRIGVAAAVAVAVVLPWLVFVVWHGHGRGQDSSAALTVLRHRGLTVGASGWEPVTRDLRTAVARLVVPVAGYPVLDRLALLALAVAALASLGQPAARAWYRRTAGLTAGVVALFVLYATVLGGTREWYDLSFLALVAAVALPGCGAAVASALGSVAGRRRPHAIGYAGRGGPSGRLLLRFVPVLAGLAAAAGLLAARLPAANPQEADKRAAAAVATRVVPAGQPIGAFNSGVYTFFMRQPVVNLDGVVNSGASQAMASGTLCRYMGDHGIRWLLDDDGTLRELPRLAPGLSVVEETDLSAAYGAGAPYRVARRQLLVRVDTGRCS